MKSLRQGEKAIHHRKTLHDHFGIDEIEIVTLWNCRFQGSGHPGDILPDEIQQIGRGITLLQHIMTAAEVINPGAALLEPGIVPLKAHAEPCRHPRNPVLPGLMNVEVKYEVVDALGESPIAPALHGCRRLAEVEARGKGFCRGDLLAIDVRRRGGPAQLDAAEVPEVVEVPELA